MKLKLGWCTAFVIVGVWAGVGLSGCSSVPKNKTADPKYLPKYLKEQACKPGRDIKKVAGSLWMKVQTPDPQGPNGQLPATVVAEAPHHLRLEVTNLIGSTEASISIDGEKYQIDVPASKKQKRQQEKGSKSWAGLPLKWGTELFLGRIPCPSATELENAKLSVTPDGDLTMEIQSSAQKIAQTTERYEYHFRNLGGESWPESLHYEQKRPVELKVGARTQPPVIVDFKFDDPESGTLSPRKWEAKSAQGNVKVRWRDRDVSR